MAEKELGSAKGFRHGSCYACHMSCRVCGALRRTRPGKAGLSVELLLRRVEIVNGELRGLVRRAVTQTIGQSGSALPLHLSPTIAEIARTIRDAFSAAAGPAADRGVCRRCGDPKIRRTRGKQN